MIIRPAKRIIGRISLPGDKSISHRAAMLSALASGETHISNFAASADCHSTLNCLRALGVEIERRDSLVLVRGRGKFLQPPETVLDCGNSGTTMRLLAGILAGQAFTSVLDGDESLRGRPMKRIIEPLTEMGAAIESSGGLAPLNIIGGLPLKGIRYEPDVSSAQVKSCILLAAMFADGKTTVVEKVPTRDHTERMLKWMGAEISDSGDDAGHTVSIAPTTELRAAPIDVPGDISSAAFFAVAASCLDDSELVIEKVGLNPTRTGILDVLLNCGADVQISNLIETNNEPRGHVLVKSMIPGKTDPVAIGGSVIANVIDEIPILAVMGTKLEGGMEIRGARELRVKESDRIRSVVTNLRAMGAEVEEFDDGMKIAPSRLTGARIDSFGDHRIAMAFAVAGLIADGDTEIAGHKCADISFPGFFEMLESIVER